ncbi:unnamed protein product [Rotaria socialis]|uniref:Uncharacterized protein n=1 Tax=Rotaria socialis TaxID=392032 RepID=A0A820I2R8_9BILA|nr:unnamed protein product [Rotaria socialis]CAF4303855.1 unnamed protein product [Rotaria socialis]
MASTTHTAKPITIDFRKYKEKENRRPEASLNVQHVSSNSGSSGSLPKRYQSVFTDSTPITSFGIRNDDHYSRSHSPPNRTQPQIHQRPLKSVKEFLTTHSTADQRIDDRRRSSSQTNGFTRSQAEATIQNVNVALTKTLNKLRPEPSNTGSTNIRSTSIYVGPSSTRPITARVTTHQNTGTTTTTPSSSNYFYQLPGSTKGPLPAELITRRPTSSFGTNILPNSTSHSRLSTGTGTGSLVLPQSATIKSETKFNDNANTRISTPLRAPAKSVDIGLHQLDGFNFDNVTLDEHQEKLRAGKNELNQQTITKITSRKQSSAPRAPSADSQRALPEVSVNPQIQSSVQQNTDQLPYVHESIQNGIFNHHIQVEPTNTMKRTSSSSKSQQILDVQPTIIVHRQQRSASSASRPNSAATAILPSTIKNPLSEAYIDRENIRSQVFIPESTNNNNDSTSTLKQYDNQKETKKNTQNSSTPPPPPSPSNKESNRLWKKQRNKYSTKASAAALVTRKNAQNTRPPARLKNYEDDSDSETIATESQGKEDDMTRRHGNLQSDLGSDAWSDLTSEFSDTKLRKHPNIRTSTPNITRYSSSLSSKEVGQIRKQLTDLQIMYNDLLKLLDVDIESVRSSIKSSTSSQVERNGRKHRFRKVMPVMSMPHSNPDMKEINQRFTRVESSIVTLAESIAKLSAQIQMQRVIKDDVYHLRQEVAELRQQVYQQYPRQQQQQQQPSTPAGGRTSSMSTTSQQQSRLITANAQRLTTTNRTNPLNISTSYMPSTSTILRSNSIIDPRQARKIEQFFGAEAMLRYFLSLLNYEEYVPVLEQEKIVFYELPYISERKLQSLGIPYEFCTRIIYEAQQYFISLLTLKSNGIDV